MLEGYLRYALCTHPQHRRSITRIVYREKDKNETAFEKHFETTVERVPGFVTVSTVLLNTHHRVTYSRWQA